jgi:farnesyl diphosphate synthase
MTGFHEQLQCDASACELVLKQLIAASTGPASKLRGAMEYGLLNGGKRMRASLVLAAARMVSGDVTDTDGALRTAAALECLHAYSLIHDDLPAMDDADTRRGKPSCHKLFDDATAILAGDALQSMAFNILAADATHDDATIRVRLIAQLADSSGLAGMVGGQMLDLEAEGRPFDLAETKQMQMMKTGALISCAVLSGGIVAGADQELLSAQAAYAKHLGLAFQIADDLLDYVGDSGVLGKPAGQDAPRGKAGFVVLMGHQAAAIEARRLIDDANKALAPWQEAAKYMQDLAEFAITRKI